MTQGFERQAEAVDNLRGAEAVEPVTRQVPSMQGVSTPSVAFDSYGAQIAGELQKWSTGRLAEIQRERQERSMREGQLAALQGKSFEAVEMEGDKWALEGYRIVTAQSMSASLLRAQEQEINTGMYELDPEGYRQRLSNRIEQLTSGITDPRIKELAQEQFLQAAPTLLDSHMKQHLGFQEQQNFDALAASIDVLSQDGSKDDNLVAFAMGTSEATQGLSIARRRAAVVQGVVDAFQNGNPAAWAKLDAAGFFNTSNLTTSQLQQIESAKNQFQTKMEQEWNEDHQAEKTRIEDLIVQGAVTPSQAAELHAANNAKHWRRTTAESAGQVWENARRGWEFAQGTRGMNIQAAGMAGDYRTQAALMQEAVIWQESRGRPDAISPKGATGIMQVMPTTAMRPSYGLPNIFQVAKRMGIPYSGTTEADAKQLLLNPELNKEFGTMYLAGALREHNGDVVKALIAYNAGGRWADRYNGSNLHEMPAETQGYVKNITSAWTDDIPDARADRIAAEERLKEYRERAGLAAYEAAMPYLDMRDQRYKSDPGYSRDEWIADRRSDMAAHGMEVDMQVLNHEAQINRSVLASMEKAVQDQVATEQEIMFRDDLRVLNHSFDEVTGQIERGELTDPGVIQMIATSMAQAREALHNKHGIPMSASEESRARDAQVQDVLDAVRKGEQARMQATERARMLQNGMGHVLSPEQQQAAIREHREQTMRSAQNLVASGSQSPEAVAEQVRTQEMQYLASNGIVDPQTKAVINAGLQQPMIVNGEINPAYQEAIQSYMDMRTIAPHVANQYLDNENKGPVAAITNRVGTAGNLAAAIHGYHVAMEAAPKQPFAMTDEEILADRRKHIRALAQTNSNAPTMLESLRMQIQGTREASQFWDRQDWNSELREAYADALEKELVEINRWHPNIAPRELVGMAKEIVDRRYAHVGGELIDAGEGADVYQMFFGGRAEEMRGRSDAINSAVINYMRSPQFQRAHPDASRTTFWERFGSALFTESGLGPVDAIAVNTTGVRPYHMMFAPQADGSREVIIQYNLPGGGWSEPIRIDPAYVGAQELGRVNSRKHGGISGLEYVPSTTLVDDPN